MKKSILVLGIVLLGFAGTSFAATAKSAGPVPASVESEFTQRFAGAQDIQWEAGKNFFKATFEEHGRTLFAFYAGNGDLMGVASNLTSTNLPAGLRSSIKNNYFDYWITDLFSFRNANEKGFVVTLENPNNVVLLKSVGHGEWTVYKTMVKS